MNQLDYRNESPNHKWVKAILSLKPGAKFSCIDQKLTWLDADQTEPTSSEITAEINRLETLSANEEYQRKRRAEYPAWEKQLDYIYHNGIAKWKTDIIQPVKDKYPKPN